MLGVVEKWEEYLYNLTVIENVDEFVYTICENLDEITLGFLDVLYRLDRETFDKIDEQIEYRYRERLQRFVCQYSILISYAEDLVSEVFLKLREAIDDGITSPQWKVKDWLFWRLGNLRKQIAREIRREMPMPIGELYSGAESSDFYIPDPIDYSPQPHQTLAWEEIYKLLKNSFAHLKLRDREIVIFCLLGIRHKEIKEATGVKNVSVYRNRALKEWGKFLNRQGVSKEEFSNALNELQGTTFQLGTWRDLTLSTVMEAMKIEHPDKVAEKYCKAGEAIIPVLIDVLNYSDAESIRWAVAGALGKSGDARAIPILVKTLGDEPWICNSDDVSLPRIHGGVERVALALGKIGEPAAPALIRELVHAEKGIRQVHFALEHLSEAAVPTLIEALNDKRELIRIRVAGILGKIGEHRPEPAKTAVPALTEALRDEAGWVRRNAAETLGRIGKPAQDAVPLLIEMVIEEFDDENEEVAACRKDYFMGKGVPWLIGAFDKIGLRFLGLLIEALGRIGDARAVPALIKVLSDTNNRLTCRTAIEALGRIGWAAKDAVPLLIKASHDDSPYREAAICALHNIDDARALPVLREWLRRVESSNDRLGEGICGAYGDQ